MKSSRQSFHERHEVFTDIIYRSPGMLPSRYVLVLTNLCNLRCHFCFQKKDLRQDRMTLKDWMKLIEQLPPYARVTLTGGEPLMFPEFKEAFAFVAQRFDCNMISNGLLLNEDTTDFLLSYPRFRVLSISVDDFKNKVRGVSERQWGRCEKMLRYFVQHKKKQNSSCILEVKTVILDENAAYLFDLYRYCMEELGCDQFSFQFLKGSPIQHADEMFPLEDILKKSHAVVYQKFDTIKEQLEKVRQYNVRFGKEAFLHPKVSSLISEEPIGSMDFLNEREHLKEHYQSCRFPWSSVHINVDGELFPCLAVSMGNVKRMPLAEIIHGKEFCRFKDLIHREGTVEGCNRCGWLRPVKEGKRTPQAFLPGLEILYGEEQNVSGGKQCLK